MIIPDRQNLPTLILNRAYSFQMEFPFDISSYNCKMQVREEDDKDSNLLAEFNISAVGNTLNVSLPVASHSSFPRTKAHYPYELVMATPGGEPETYLVGYLPVVLDISEAP